MTLTGPVTGLVDAPQTFIAQTSLASATLSTVYTWEGTEQLPLTATNGISHSATFSWSSPGSKVITVTASNSVFTDQSKRTILITDVPLAGLAAANNSPTQLGSATTLTATVTAGTNVSYAWGFGDGETGHGSVVTHTYPAAGVYTAVVTAGNSTSVLTTAMSVRVGMPPPIHLPIVIKG